VASDSPAPPLGPENSGDLSSAQPVDDFSPLHCVTTYTWQEPPEFALQLGDDTWTETENRTETPM
jgi:hypothetical protein